MKRNVETLYSDLRRILNDSFDWSAKKKGAQRHGQGGLPWDQQRHVTIGNAVGRGFALGQALKKIMESEGMDAQAAINELHGAITYLASAVYMIEQEEPGDR